LEELLNSFSITFILYKPGAFPYLEIISYHVIEHPRSVFLPLLKDTGVLFEHTLVDFKLIDLLINWYVFLSQVDDTLVHVFDTSLGISNIIKMLSRGCKNGINKDVLTANVDLCSKVKVNMLSLLISNTLLNASLPPVFVIVLDRIFDTGKMCLLFVSFQVLLPLHFGANSSLFF
jgi:hypothetical protein